LSASETHAQVTRPGAKRLCRRRGVRFNADRQVVVVNRLPDRLWLAGLAGVHAAHHTLKFRELTDHVRREVRFREFCRAARRVRRCGLLEDIGRQPDRQSLDSLGLLPVRPKRPVEQQAVEFRKPGLEPGLAIGIPEKPCVAQPRRHDTFGVGRHAAIVARLRVRHGEKRRHQRARCGHDREVVLMVNQRRRQDLRRKREELVIEDAGDDRRELHEVRHFVQKGFGLRVLMEHGASAELAGVRVEVAHDAIAAIDARQDHEVLSEALAILVEAPHLDRAARTAAGRQEAVTVCDGARW
jgi:hypothetical protein